MISTLWIIQKVPKAGSPEHREKARQMAKRFEKQVRGSAIIVSATGLDAVFARAFLAGFSLVSQSQSPTKVFTRVVEAVSWLQMLPGQDAGLAADAGLTEAIQRFAALPHELAKGIIAPTG
jgi:hypothetical protein